MSYFDPYEDEIFELLHEYNDVKADVARYLYHKYPEISIEANRSEDVLRRTLSNFIRAKVADKDIISENVRYKKQTQKFQDLNRIGNKSFRDHARIENSIEEYNKELITLLKEFGLSIDTKSHKVTKVSTKMIVHLSDTHFNELVDIESNKYDFKIASKRLHQFANDIKRYAKANNCKQAVIAFGGDLLNSDRRLDELLSGSTNRAKATQLSIRLLIHFINDLNKSLNIDCVGVTGNESRAKQELGWSDILASDSYDFTIYDSLKIMYEGKKGVSFQMMRANESLFTVNGKCFLLIHGHQLKSDVQKSVQHIIGKYSNKGIVIDYVLAGHIHSAYISDYFSRNASLTGSNAYSEEALGFVSKASQNIHFVYDHDKIDSIKIDLQDYSQAEGYPIESALEAYNAKSLSKTKKQHVIHQVVI